MLKFAQLCGLIEHSNRQARRRKASKEASNSVDLSVRLKNSSVRVIHAGGRVELYQCEISASELMERYPGMLVARPEVFKRPHESLLLAEEKLLPGYKYYVIPSTTVEKLKRNHSKKCKVKESSNSNEVLDGDTVADTHNDCSDDSVCSGMDFYISREIRTRRVLRKCQRGKRPFVPPIQNPKISRDLGWEPSLDSVQEISP